MKNLLNDKKKLTSVVVMAVVLIAFVVCSLVVRAPETHECHDCGGVPVYCEVCGTADHLKEQMLECDDCSNLTPTLVCTNPECFDKLNAEVTNEEDKTMPLALTCEGCEGAGSVENPSRYSETFMALAAPIIAIVLALITKEVYSSLFIGILIGGLLNAGYNIPKTLDFVINDGLISAVSGSAGIFIFLVILGIMVILVNKSGGSAAFGRWAQKNIKTKLGATIATFVLGILIFIDDYFNCLTVGSVMRPVTDTHKISRSKLAFLIDATAAPICMIAPISSWAAAVAEYAPEGTSGLVMFIKAIPFNFYSILTLVFVIAISIMGFDYGKMSGFEIKAQNGDLGAIESEESEEAKEIAANEKGRVLDLVLPIVVLIVTCVIALIYVGGFFGEDIWGGTDNAGNFIGAFGNTDATIALPWGSIIALLFTIVYFMIRKTVSFKESMEAVPKGFIAMVPAILILTFATALKNMTSLLGAKEFVAGIVNGAGTLGAFLPAIIFIVACCLAFSTGTSWGTFGILIPIVTAIFPDGSMIQIIAMSACLAGAVCGDHCSPISDTTIMASAGAQCNHVEHVQTQLPYAITVAAVSFVSFILAGVLDLANVAWIAIPVSIALMIGTLFVIKKVTKKNV